jgi:hypothetical protein
MQAATVLLSLRKYILPVQYNFPLSSMSSTVSDHQKADYYEASKDCSAVQQWNYLNARELARLKK